MRTIATLIFFIKLFSITAQNLVPNWSFEDFTICPDGLGQVEYANSWTSFANTCDYYNACAPQGLLSIPLSVFGYQEALDGNAYAGLLTFNNPDDSNSREYLGVQLLEPLSIGEEYFISFYVSRAGGDPAGYATNNLGALFTSESFSELTPLYPENQSHINETEVLSDTTFWHQVKGFFVSDSNYQFLAIGNFYTIENTDTLYTDGLPNQAYYFIDAVRVSTDSVYAWQSLSSVEAAKYEIVIFPNPFTDKIVVSNSVDVISYQIMNNVGQIVKTSNTKNENTITIGTIELPIGNYYIKIIEANRVSIYKLFKNY